MATVNNIIQDIKEELYGLPGVVGVVLGGSRVRGTHSPDSDIDIGVFCKFEVHSIATKSTQCSHPIFSF